MESTATRWSSMGRGQRLTAMTEMNRIHSIQRQVPSSTASAPLQDATADVSSSLSSPTSSTMSSNSVQSESQMLHTDITSKTTSTRCWTTERQNAILSGARATSSRSNGKRSQGRSQSLRSQRTETVTRRPVYNERKFPGHTSYKGYDVDYLNDLLENERNQPNMNDIPWE